MYRQNGKSEKQVLSKWNPMNHKTPKIINVNKTSGRKLFVENQ